MSSFGLKVFTVWCIVHVTFGQNPLDEIISSAVQRILEGVETRLLKQTQLLESRLSEQTQLLETRLAENTRATNERMTGLEELVVKESSANTTEARLRENLVHTTLTVTALLQGLEQRMKKDTQSHVHDIMRHGNSIAHRLEENMTSEVKSSGHKIEHHTQAAVQRLEGKIVNETKSLVHDLEGRLSASCSGASEDLRWLLSEVQNASAQVAVCCAETPTEKPGTTSTPTEKPTTTPTPTERPKATSTPTEKPTTTPTPTETPLEVVFLRRQDGIVDFYRDWEAYKSGFGNQTGEFWLGLDHLHNMTIRHNYSIRADIEDWSGEIKWEEYSTFRVAGEGAGYELTVSGYNPASTAGHNLFYNSGRSFSTHDRNDMWSGDCAILCQGAWWYGGCTHANPTGPYKPAGYRGQKGIYWYRANTPYDLRSFKGVTIRLVRV